MGTTYWNRYQPIVKELRRSNCAAGSRCSSQEHAPGVEAEVDFGEVAERTGFSRPTLRYYEEIGLLAPVSQ